MKRKVFVSVTGVNPAGSHSVSGGAGTEEVLLSDHIIQSLRTDAVCERRCHE